MHFAVVHPLHELVHFVLAGVCSISCTRKQNSPTRLQKDFRQYLYDLETTWHWFNFFCFVINPQQEILHVVLLERLLITALQERTAEPDSKIRTFTRYLLIKNMHFCTLCISLHTFFLLEYILLTVHQGTTARRDY